MALGLYNFEYSNNDLMQVIMKIKHILQDYDNEIDTFVLGYPQNLVSDRINDSCLRAQKFKKLLETNFNTIPVVLQDENFTTRRATDLLMQSDIKASQRKKVIDMISSQIILEDYLATLK